MLLSITSCVIAILACLIQAESASNIADQSITNFTLYAYGTGIAAGLQFFYGDGYAYVGPQPPSFVTEALNITCKELYSKSVFALTNEAVSATDSQTAFVASAIGGSNWTSQPQMYIDTSANAFNAVGFTFSNASLMPGETIEGFGLYGGWAFHKNDNDKVEMKFYATPTNETDVYQVKWNAASTSVSDGVAIALRTVAPNPDSS